jgi:hypothetical protein
VGGRSRCGPLSGLRSLWDSGGSTSDDQGSQRSGRSGQGSSSRDRSDLSRWGLSCGGQSATILTSYATLPIAVLAIPSSAVA